jgi:hypothetical protein
MAREDIQLDEGATGAPRVSRPRNDTSQVSEADINAAVARAGQDLEVDPVTLAYEAGLTGDRSKPLNKMTPEERAAFTEGSIAKQTQGRVLTQSGMNPDNPMPSEDPGPGMYWANYGGTWRKYKYVTNPVAGGGNGGFVDTKAVTQTSLTQTGLKTEAQIAAETAAAVAKGERQSAYDLLYSQFKLYGLESLVEPLKGLITSGASPSEFTIKLRESDAYKKRFSANAQRINKGLKAISEAEYLGLEDQYQNIMRNYGLPAEYYARGDMGMQEGFNKFIANDVSASELEDRIMTAQSRVINANPEVLASLKAFYPDITNGDILAYTLDPTKALTDIKRKVTAAEIGGAATQAGLQTGMARAEELGAAGITKAQAQQGYGTIGSGLQRGSQLASIYGESPYTQTTAEKEVFGLAGKTEAEKERKKLTGLERATFSGQTGLTTGALARDRAGAY